MLTQESNIPTYQRMWAFMEGQEPSVFVMNSQEGIDKVMKEDYAFLMESTMIDYTVQRECDLMQVGGLLDTKGYGIGTPIGECITFKHVITIFQYHTKLRTIETIGAYRDTKLLSSLHLSFLQKLGLNSI